MYHSDRSDPQQNILNWRRQVEQTPVDDASTSAPSATNTETGQQEDCEYYIADAADAATPTETTKSASIPLKTNYGRLSTRSKSHSIKQQKIKQKKSVSPRSNNSSKDMKTHTAKISYNSCMNETQNVEEVTSHENAVVYTVMDKSKVLNRKDELQRKIAEREKEIIRIRKILAEMAAKSSTKIAEKASECNENNQTVNQTGQLQVQTQPQPSSSSPSKRSGCSCTNVDIDANAMEKNHFKKNKLYHRAKTNLEDCQSTTAGTTIKSSQPIMTKDISARQTSQSSRSTRQPVLTERSQMSKQMKTMAKLSAENKVQNKQQQKQQCKRKGITNVDENKLQKEQIKKRLEDLRKNTQKLVAKNLQKKQMVQQKKLSKKDYKEIYNEENKTKVVFENEEKLELDKHLEVLYTAKGFQTERLLTRTPYVFQTPRSVVSAGALIRITLPQQQLRQHQDQLCINDTENSSSIYPMSDTNRNHIGILRKPGSNYEHSVHVNGDIYFSKENLPSEPIRKTTARSEVPVTTATPATTTTTAVPATTATTARTGVPASTMTSSQTIMENPEDFFIDIGGSDEDEDEVRNLNDVFSVTASAAATSQSDHVPSWLKPNAAYIYPYNFILAIRRKLEVLAQTTNNAKVTDDLSCAALAPSTSISAVGDVTTSPFKYYRNEPQHQRRVHANCHLESPSKSNIIQSKRSERYAEAKTHEKQQTMSPNFGNVKKISERRAISIRNPSNKENEEEEEWVSFDEEKDNGEKEGVEKDKRSQNLREMENQGGEYETKKSEEDDARRDPLNEKQKETNHQSNTFNNLMSANEVDQVGLSAHEDASQANENETLKITPQIVDKGVGRTQLLEIHVKNEERIQRGQQQQQHHAQSPGNLQGEKRAKSVEAGDDDNGNLTNATSHSEIGTNLSSISIQTQLYSNISNTHTLREMGSMKTESKLTNTKIPMMDKAKHEKEIKLDIENREKVMRIRAKVNKDDNNDHLSKRSVSPLSLKCIEPMKVQRKQAIITNKQEEIQQQQQYSSLNRSIDNEVDFSQLLEDFNHSLTQVIQVNQQLKYTLDKSEKILSPRQNHKPQLEEEMEVEHGEQEPQQQQQLRSDNMDYSTDFEMTSSELRAQTDTQGQHIANKQTYNEIFMKENKHLPFDNIGMKENPSNTTTTGIEEVVQEAKTNQEQHEHDTNADINAPPKLMEENNDIEEKTLCAADLESNLRQLSANSSVTSSIDRMQINNEIVVLHGNSDDARIGDIQSQRLKEINEEKMNLRKSINCNEMLRLQTPSLNKINENDNNDDGTSNEISSIKSYSIMPHSNIRGKSITKEDISIQHKHHQQQQQQQEVKGQKYQLQPQEQQQKQPAQMGPRYHHHHQTHIETEAQNNELVEIFNKKTEYFNKQGQQQQQQRNQCHQFTYNNKEEAKRVKDKNVKENFDQTEQVHQQYDCDELDWNLENYRIPKSVKNSIKSKYKQDTFSNINKELLEEHEEAEGSSNISDDIKCRTSSFINYKRGSNYHNGGNNLISPRRLAAEYDFKRAILKSKKCSAESADDEITSTSTNGRCNYNTKRVIPTAGTTTSPNNRYKKLQQHYYEGEGVEEPRIIKEARAGMGLKQNKTKRLNETMSESSLNYSNVGLYDKLIQNEMNKSLHLMALLKMREKALLDRTKGQIAWLEVQKARYKAKGLTSQMAAVKKKQRGIILKMQKEREEIQRLLQTTSTNVNNSEGNKNLIAIATSTTLATICKTSQKHLGCINNNNTNNLATRRDNHFVVAASTETTATATTTTTATARITPSKLLPRHIQLFPPGRRKATTPSSNSKCNEISDIEHTQNGIISNTKILKASYELETPKVLEELLKKREEDLRKRRQHVQHLLNWHQRLDAEEDKVLQLEQHLLNYNQPKHNKRTYNNNNIDNDNDNHNDSINNQNPYKHLSNDQQQKLLCGDKLTELKPISPIIDNTNVTDRERVTRARKMERRLEEIEQSLRELKRISPPIADTYANSTNSVSNSPMVVIEGVSEESSPARTNVTTVNNAIATATSMAKTAGMAVTVETEYIRTSGMKLNKLWRRLTSQQIEKYDPNRRYKLCKAHLESLYEEAKLTVLQDFVQDEERIAIELLEKSVSNMSTVTGNSNSTERTQIGEKDSESSGPPIIPELNLNFSSESAESEQEEQEYITPITFNVKSQLSQSHGKYCPSNAEHNFQVMYQHSNALNEGVTDNSNVSTAIIEDCRNQRLENNVQLFSTLTKRIAAADNSHSNKIANIGGLLQRSVSDTQLADSANRPCRMAFTYENYNNASQKNLGNITSQERQQKQPSTQQNSQFNYRENEKPSCINNGEDLLDIKFDNSATVPDIPLTTVLDIPFTKQIKQKTSNSNVMETVTKRSQESIDNSSYSIKIKSCAEEKGEKRPISLIRHKSCNSDISISTEYWSNKDVKSSNRVSSDMKTKQTFSGQVTRSRQNVRVPTSSFNNTTDTIMMVNGRSNDMTTRDDCNMNTEQYVSNSSYSTNFKRNTIKDGDNGHASSNSHVTTKNSNSNENNKPKILLSLKKYHLDNYETVLETNIEDVTYINDISVPIFESTLENDETEEEVDDHDDDIVSNKIRDYSNVKSPSPSPSLQFNSLPEKSSQSYYGLKTELIKNPTKDLNENTRITIEKDDLLPPTPKPPPPTPPLPPPSATAASSHVQTVNSPIASTLPTFNQMDIHVSSSNASNATQLMPDIINELELRRHQLILDNEHLKQYEHVTAVPYMYVREIPNKPPPPYVPPAHGSPMTTIFPSEERIKDITFRRTHELYCKFLNTDYCNENGEKLPSVMEEQITNIYERIILDICHEYLEENQDILHNGDPRNYHNQLAFFNPPNRLLCIQNAVYKEVRKCLAMDKVQPKRSQIYSVYGQTDKQDYIGKIIIEEMFEEDARWRNFHQEEGEVLELIIEEMIRKEICKEAYQVFIEEGGSECVEEERNEEEEMDKDIPSENPIENYSNNYKNNNNNHNDNDNKEDVMCKRDQSALISVTDTAEKAVAATTTTTTLAAAAAANTAANTAELFKQMHY